MNSESYNNKILVANGTRDMIGYLYAILLAFLWSVASIFYRYAVRNGNVLLVTTLRVYPAFIVVLIGVNLIRRIEISHLYNPPILFLAIITYYL